MEDTKKPIDEFKAEVDAAKQHEVDSKLQEMGNEVARYKRRYDDLLAAHERFRQESIWMDTLSESYESPAVIESKGKTGTGEGTVIAVASDWHVFETVKPEQVNGLNTYNTKIAENSILEFFNGVLAWTEIHRTKLNIKTLVLALLGDFITNTLHEDQKEDNAGPVQEETLFALQHLCGGIDFLVENGGFTDIHLVCCPGNHSRDTREVYRAAGVAQHTYEWLMYKVMSDFVYPGRKDLHFHIAEGYHNFLETYGKDIRFHHGDWVRYMGGVGGLTIPMNKAIKSWNIGRAAHFDIFGHWHQTLNPGLFLSNGSILGYSAYAIKIKGDYERPQQSLLTIDSKRFITSVNRIYVR
jgi:hypothetical protein